MVLLLSDSCNLRHHVFHHIEPRFTLGVPELPLRVKSLHELNKLCDLGELLCNIHWISIIHAFGPVLPEPNGLQF